MEITQIHPYDAFDLIAQAKLPCKDVGEIVYRVKCVDSPEGYEMRHKIVDIDGKLYAITTKVDAFLTTFA